MNQFTKITYKNKAGSIVFDVAGDFWIDSIEGIETTVEIDSTQNTGQIGASLGSQSVLPKEITVNGVIVRCIEPRRRQLVNVLVPLLVSRLIFRLENGEEWYLEGYLKQLPILSDGMRPQSFQFRFFSPYPYFRSTRQKSYPLSGLRSLWHTPFTVAPHAISRYNDEKFVRAENKGNIAQAFVIRLLAKAKLRDPVVWLVDENKKIAVKKEMQQGDEIIISTHDADKDDGTAVQYRNAAGLMRNGYRFITPESDLSMRIPPGGCTFAADAEENRQNLICTVIAAEGERHGI